MAERKRLSGAQYRKRRAEKQKDETKQEDSFLKYICTPHRNEDGPELNNQNEAEKISVSEEFEPQNQMHGRTKKQNLKDIYHAKIQLVYVLTMAILLLGPNLMIVYDKF